MPKLSQSVVERAKPRDREFIVWDSAVHGFGLRVKPRGVRSFVIQYRNKYGQSRRYTVGRYGVLTVDEARTEARTLLADAAKGKDPARERQADRGASTVAELADRYLREHAKPHKKPSSYAEDERLVDKRIKPKLGSIRIPALARADVAKLHHAMRETPYEANRVLALLSHMCAMAELWGLRPEGSNPCRLVKRFKEAKRERFFTADELKALGKALAEAEAKGALPGPIAALRLLALTGCRQGEILSLRWEHVDMDKGLLRLPDAKAGARAVPLSAAAKAVLAGLDEAGPWVVHGPDPERPLAEGTLQNAWRAARDATGLKNARIHDFRHTVGTYGGQAGFNAFVVRDMLGHKTLAMTGRYVERDVDPVRAAADQVADRIAAAMDAPEEEAEVVELAKVSG